MGSKAVRPGFFVAHLFSSVFFQGPKLPPCTPAEEIEKGVLEGSAWRVHKLIRHEISGHTVDGSFKILRRNQLRLVAVPIIFKVL